MAPTMLLVHYDSVTSFNAVKFFLDMLDLKTDGNNADPISVIDFCLFAPGKDLIYQSIQMDNC